MALIYRCHSLIRVNVFLPTTRTGTARMSGAMRSDFRPELVEYFTTRGCYNVVSFSHIHLKWTGRCHLSPCWWRPKTTNDDKINDCARLTIASQQNTGSVLTIRSSWFHERTTGAITPLVVAVGLCNCGKGP